LNERARRGEPLFPLQNQEKKVQISRENDIFLWSSEGTTFFMGRKGFALLDWNQLLGGTGKQVFLVKFALLGGSERRLLREEGRDHRIPGRMAGISSKGDTTREKKRGGRVFSFEGKVL